MVETLSTMQPLGSDAPGFDVTDVVTGKRLTLDDFQGRKAFLIMFICRHCPFVIHVRDELARIGRDYDHPDVGILAVSSNDVKHYPQDGPEKLAAMARELRFTFPFALDESQETAKAFGAACTPDFFLYDRDLKLVYRGQLDDSRPGNGRTVDGEDLRAALDAVLEGRPVNPDQQRSIGCNIKWKPGNEPDYFRKR